MWGVSFSSAKNKFKIGIDRGQQFLKVSLQYIGSNKNSVSQCLIIAVAEAKESNYNFKAIAELLKLQDLINKYEDKFLFVSDMKALQLMVGIKGGRSTYPCLWCHFNGRKKCNIDETYDVRRDNTLGRNSDPVFDLENFGSFYGLPMLHLLLGLVNTILKRIFKKMNEEEKLKYQKVFVDNGICSTDYFVNEGEINLEGNGCRKILQNVDLFKPGRKYGKLYQPIISFSLFRSAYLEEQIDKTKFNLSLAEFIKDFKTSGMQPTLKLHILNTHLKDILEKNEEVCFLDYTEEALESSHRAFKGYWEGKHYKRSQNNKNYEKNLLNCLFLYNVERFSTIS